MLEAFLKHVATYRVPHNRMSLGGGGGPSRLASLLAAHYWLFVSDTVICKDRDLSPII
jgi:hypothetical protein